MIKKVRKILSMCVTLALTAGVALFAVSCNSEDVIEAGRLPVIHPDNNGVYIGYAGHELTLTLHVENDQAADYVWTIDDQVVSTQPQLVIKRDHVCTLYAVLTVTNGSGSARTEIRVEFIDPERPLIDMGAADGTVDVLLGTTHVFAPVFTGVDNAIAPEWRLDNQPAGNGFEYVFQAKTLGVHTLSVTAFNQFGSTEASVMVRVVDRLPYSVYFQPRSPLDPSTDMVGVVGRPVYVQSYTSNITPGTYVWSVDGRGMSDNNKSSLRFTPQAPGRYLVTVSVTGTTPTPGGGTAEVETVSSVIINVYAEQGRIRSGSSTAVNTVFEYIAAPGQFINDTDAQGGFDGSETTPDAANAYAERRLSAGMPVSLGAFGGYIVAGFDHSVRPRGREYDFAVIGNAFDTSSEPGIVWVMQDTNGNGLPDDQWYQLRGSESDKATTLTDYAVTYRRGTPGRDIEWTDNRGNSGVVPAMAAFHHQPSIYPAWIEAGSYTLYGTRLEARNSLNPASGQWVNAPYDWGYADNMGADVIGNTVSAGEGRPNGFRISNAILPDGTPVSLDFIDFVKIQTGAVGTSGILGEISTEILGIVEL